MPRRPLAHVGAEVSGRITAIDDAIDYFGGGTSTSPGRESAPYGRHARL
jgi:hypothetical protein